jgi:hypothetical protein
LKGSKAVPTSGDACVAGALNGSVHDVHVDGEAPLLWMLRDTRQQGDIG